MAKAPMPAKDAGDLVATEVTAVHRLPGIIFRPGIVYQASAAMRQKLDDAGVLRKAPDNKV